MRHVIASLLVAGCVSSTGLAFQARAAGAAAGKACALLTRDLVMKVSTAAGRAGLERAKPSDDYAGPGVSSCKYGRVALILDPFKQPEQVRSAMRTRTAPYKNHERVTGVGDEAFFESNSAFANLYVWTGARQFHVQLGAGFEDDAKALKPNAIALANALIPQLR
jgi:hypothetical protein